MKKALGAAILALTTIGSTLVNIAPAHASTVTGGFQLTGAHCSVSLDNDEYAAMQAATQFTNDQAFMNTLLSQASEPGIGEAIHDLAVATNDAINNFKPSGNLTQDMTAVNPIHAQEQNLGNALRTTTQPFITDYLALVDPQGLSWSNSFTGWNNGAPRTYTVTNRDGSNGNGFAPNLIYDERMAYLQAVACGTISTQLWPVNSAFVQYDPGLMKWKEKDYATWRGLLQIRDFLANQGISNDRLNARLESLGHWTIDYQNQADFASGTYNNNYPNVISYAAAPLPLGPINTFFATIGVNELFILPILGAGIAGIVSALKS